MTKIRLGLWLDIDIDEAKKEMLDNDERIPADITEDDLIDYLASKMTEQINNIAMGNDVEAFIKCEEIK